MRNSKLLVALGLVVTMGFFASCKKEYTCTCKIGESVLKTQNLGKMSKKKATKECDALVVFENEVCSI